ncbi:hypothetical protein EX895_002286 [Sporisorium graminicola]|uniref:SWR1-complex protein 5 n=1 Tax=Sporisorium graminicola TaxID=280036 RepID=A0A4U7KVF3_9BASI|nr:hypothetical protein EX895_002286 [Sporisorium graminicola]TKY88655.1 hypothetical protein EX895_002286 [Sporisorium graminicola]
MAADPLSRSELNTNTASDSDSDFEDDDFVPEPELSRGAAAAIQASYKLQTQRPGADDASDSDSDDEDSDGEAKGAGSRAVAGEQIDADELEALKREREEMVAAAGGEGRLGKRARLAKDAVAESAGSMAVNDEAEALKAKALAEWENIKGDGPTSTTSTGDGATSQEAQSGSSTTTSTEEIVSIPTTYKFAGELHTSTRLLPRSHPDAIKYLSSQSASSTSAKVTTSTPVPSINPTPAVTAAAPRPPPTGPRRKKGSSLAALSAAATAKPAKLNTLEKSKLDWDSYKDDTAKLSQQEKDELEHQTKGGGKGLGDMKGYLERRDFLDRVKDRTGQP